MRSIEIQEYLKYKNILSINAVEELFVKNNFADMRASCW